MIKTLRDFREALDKMMEERGYGSKGYMQANTGTDDISDSSPDAPDTWCEISMGLIFIPPKRGDKNRANNLFSGGCLLSEAKVYKAEEVKRQYKLWTYTIRRSNRAKRLRLNITVKDGLVVVLPRGFNEKEIPAILESQANWITAGLAKVKITKALFRPTSINLPAIEETWNVTYFSTPSKQLAVHEDDYFSLVVSGESEDPYNISEALNSWMRQKAQEVFIPWVSQISEEYSLPFNRVTIRRQKT